MLELVFSCQTHQAASQQFPASNNETLRFKLLLVLDVIEPRDPRLDLDAARVLLKMPRKNIEHIGHICFPQRLH